MIDGWLWLVAYVLVMALAVAFCAGLEHLDKKRAALSLEGAGRLENDHPVKETA